MNGITETPDDWDKVRSKLVFAPEYVEGLYRLDHFKHIWIIFGFHRQKETLLKVHPRKDPSLPLVGVFATCSPTRPNKIGHTLVEIVSIRKNVVTVKGLDAFDGSPVFDIKPFEDEIDY
ncbi:MAG TPA: tRNA (N6-threonylcarbamoyladenosine(37)-N6)-methyltransferase TrmO [Thermoplasmata archaeon]|nr:tRNA (N6-threonylcarbamoyladenosine(37)-N6)-methyltransferase TrmO [Thermoplasmata archaeon]